MADPNAGLEEIIADTLDGLGQSERAAMIRDSLVPMLIGQTNWGDAIDELPKPTARHAHTDTCWKIRTGCLAIKITEIMKKHEVWE